MALVKCVTFDLDNTLVDTLNYSKNSKKYVIRSLNGELSRKYDGNAFSDIYDTFYGIVERFGPNYGYHIDQLLMGYGLDPVENHALVEYAVRKHHEFRDKHFKPFNRAVETLERLKSRGIVIGLITNGRSDKQRDKLKYLGMEKYFDFVVVSEDEEVKNAKPHTRIFQRALEKARETGPYKDLLPEECVHVGDKPVEDVLGPKKSGWGRAIRVLTPAYRHLKSRSLEEIPEVS